MYIKALYAHLFTREQKDTLLINHVSLTWDTVQYACANSPSHAKFMA